MPTDACAHEKPCGSTMVSFAVRARAVDLLGRQQIAGIPTALHELFKNAHDAYARRVEVDYFRGQRQLVLRDDGNGMSGQDFVSKWLTLGTESKVGVNLGQQMPGPRGLKPRKILGEKGIGRLAIAAIGSIVFVMTRQDPTYAVKDELTVALVHWGLFEVPAIDLSAIEIPIRTYPGGYLPTRADLQELVSELRKVVDRILSDNPLREVHVKALDAMALVDPRGLSDWLAAAAVREGRMDLSLAGNGHGTHFIVAHVDPILDADIDSKGTWGSSPFERLLLGFGNTLAGDDADFVAEFRDHHADGRFAELIGAKSFFTVDEFVSLDHHFDGRFDEFGQFTGTIQLYRGQREPYVLSWPKALGRPTDCGPFRLKLGYLMGLQDESQLPRDLHSTMYDKLNRLGGLYIYRDGIRVLPYGNSDYDFLNIEQRRTLAAKDWFFSYRRMIGWVDISFDENASLVEKAGREGFRENRPYRQFREILENFFRQLAIDYFKPGADLGDDFRQERGRIKTDYERLKRREASVSGRKAKFTADLTAALSSIEAGEPAQSVAELLRALRERLGTFDRTDSEVAAQDLLEMEADFLGDLARLRAMTAVTRPRGLAPSKSVEAAWRSYERAAGNMQENLFEPARAEGVATLEQFRSTRALAVDRQRRAVEIFGRERDASLAEVRKLRKEAENAMVKVDRAVRDAVQDEIAAFQRDVESLVAALSRTNLDHLPEPEAHERQREIERELDRRLEAGRELLSGVRDQLTAVAEAVTRSDDLEETAAALERRNVELQDRLDLYTDMAQAGSAIGILGHEFDNVASGLRQSIERLKPWASGTAALRPIYDDIVSYYGEISDYLVLFEPLSRRRHGRSSDIAGTAVEKYINEALGSRFEQTKTRLVVTDAFRKFVIKGTLPTLMGAALNLVDNAIYWIGTAQGDEADVVLDADDRGWLFSNSGPGIPLRMEERIFEFGVSTKPGGRGMGLAISRDALRKIGCELELLNAGVSERPVFRIRRNEGEISESDEA
ncbi:ATP-binding protein [Mesorhizobium sp. C120A]|uniref:ATP-binding protein n=2 Tax=Mesorhizobium TaxID=68287 RepID=UPI0004095B0C|nr:ATP-binding protein [Mesorhizobium sp. C120A]WJI43348.1 ATP-binding protein [Mesorhizobium sp. C120A]